MAGVPGTQGTTYSFSQIEQLWTTNNPNQAAWAPLMAAVAIAESGGITNNLNNNASTGDFSVGLWQINYFGANGPERVPKYGEPAALAQDPNAQARAAGDLFANGAGWGNWKGDAAIRAWQAAGSPARPSSSQVLGWGIVPGGNQAAGPGPGQAGFNSQGGGTQTGTQTATFTSTPSPTESSISGIPDTPGPPPGIDSLNPIASLASNVQWVGGLIGWSVLIITVFLFGAVLLILGGAVLVYILASPAIGPVTAAVGGKSPTGKLIGGVATTFNNRRADREDSALLAAGASQPQPRNRRQANRQAEAAGYEEGFGSKGASADSRPGVGGRVRLSDGSLF